MNGAPRVRRFTWDSSTGADTRPEFESEKHMISLTPLESQPTPAIEDFGEVEYLLRRADEETVAAIRANDNRVFASHAGMAKSYSVKSLAMIARIDGAAG